MFHLDLKSLIAAGIVLAAPFAQSETFHMRLHKVVDKEGTGKVALTYLIPKGWKATDQLKWIVNNFATPVILFSVIKSPDGLMELRSLPAAAVTFGHSPAGNSGQPPPQSVSALLLQSWQQDNPGQQYEILARQDKPMASKLFGGYEGQMRTFAQLGTLKLRFNRNGKSMVSKMSAQMDGFMTNPSATAIGGEIYEGTWVVTSVYRATATSNGLPKAMKLFGFVLTSAHVKPDFYNAVFQMQELIKQGFYQQQAATMRLSQIIAQNSREISDSIMSSYHTAQAAQDRAAENFDDSIRGIQRYSDGGTEVELPSGYSHAFSDAQGNYIITDSHLFNPNSEVRGNWHELKRKH